MYKLNNININVPRGAEIILKTIRNAGYEAYVVGGCVRDCILGRVPGDWDITTSALPQTVKSLFRNTVDTGLQHGTVTVIIAGQGYEVTTYRIDGEYKDGRHPESVEFTPSLEEDLKRRDFTINAFAYSPEDGVIDLFGGIDDLNNRLVRAVGDPRKRFDEDALRIMRAVRFSARLSFEVEKETQDAIPEIAPKLALVSAERKRVEFEKTLFSDNPSYVNKFARLGLAGYIVPDTAEKCFDAESEQLYVSQKNLTDTDRQISADEKYLRLAAFFKNLTFEECRMVMRRMTFDNKSRDCVSGIIKNKDRDFPPDRVEMKTALYEIGKDIFELTLLYQERSGRAGEEHLELLRDIEESGEPYNVSMLAVTGSDLIEAGVPQGARIGQELRRLTYEVIKEPELNTREKLLKLF